MTVQGIDLQKEPIAFLANKSKAKHSEDYAEHLRLWHFLENYFLRFCGTDAKRMVQRKHNEIIPGGFIVRSSLLLYARICLFQYRL